eukprot:397065-Amphidinium_carterae.1
MCVRSTATLAICRTRCQTEGLARVPQLEPENKSHQRDDLLCPTLSVLVFPSVTVLAVSQNATYGMDDEVRESSEHKGKIELATAAFSSVLHALMKGQVNFCVAAY